MAEFKLKYTLTEITERELFVEAENLEEAIAALESYEVDTSDSYQTDSMRWEISDVGSVDAEPEEPR